MTRHLRSGFDTMMREAELEEMQKQWAQQNADIMAATTPAPVGAHAYDASVGTHADDAPAGAPNIYDMPVVEPPLVMTGPQPSPHTLAGPAIPPEPAPEHPPAAAAP